MSDEGKDIEKPQPPRKRRRVVKTLIKIMLPIIILVGAMQYVCYYYALPIAKNHICDAVRRGSRGMYTMDFTGLRINLIGKTIEVEGFSLEPDTAVYIRRINVEQYNKAIYNIAADYLKIENIGLKSFFSKNELYIKQIEARRPMVRLAGKPNKSADEKPKYDAVHTDLYPLISQYFKALNIRHIDITDGYFDFHTKIDSQRRFGIANIDISLTNFFLDEDRFKARDKFYYSDVIEIKSRNYNIELADGIHHITAADLTISTADSTINATDVRLSPNAKASNRNRYDVALDAIEITGLDISRAYFQKDVALTDVWIKKPTIKFYNAGKVNPKSKQFEPSRADLYALIKGTLNSLSVNTIGITDASMRITKPTSKIPAFDIGKIDILLKNFALDSLSHRNRDKILYSDDLEIGISNYRMLLPDLRHTLQADALIVSTAKSLVKADKIAIRPTRSQRDSTEKTINISVPSLTVDGIDFKKAYNTQCFDIKALKISLPDIRTRSFIDSDDTTKSAAPGKGKLLTAMSNEYFRSLRICTTQIYKGKIDITSRASIEEDSLTISGKLSIIIGNLTLNRSIIKDELIPFHSNSLKLDISDVVIKPSKSLHTMRCANLTVDTRKDRVVVSDFSFSSDHDTALISSLKRLHKHSLMDIKIDRADFSKTNLIDFLYHGQVAVENLSIRHPQFAINLYPELRHQDHERGFRPEMDSMRMAMERELDSALAKYHLGDRVLARLIPRQLSLIQIDTLAADSSVFSVNIRDTANNITAGTSSDFRLSIDGFYYNKDSVSPETNFMLAKGYGLDLDNFQFLLPDKTHIVKTDNIKISTADGIVNVNGIALCPENMMEADTKSQINALCPGIRLEGVDFAAFDSTGIFPVSVCTFDSTLLTIMRTQDSVRQKPPRHGRPRRENIFHGVHIDSVRTFGSRFSVTDQNADPLVNVHIDASCRDFSLDSANVANSQNLITFANPYLDLTDIFVRVKDKNITADLLHHEGDTTQVSDFLFVNPNDTTRAGIAAPGIRFTGLDLQQLAFNKKIAAHTLYLDAPAVRITQKPKPHTNQRRHLQFTMPELKWNALIDSVYGDGVSVHLTRPTKHDLDWQKADFLIENLDTEGEHESAYPADKFLVGITDYTFHFRDSLYRINFGRAVIDPIHRSAVIDQIDYRPKVPRYELHNLFDYRKSALYFNCERVIAHDFDVPQIFAQKIDIGTLDVERFSMQSYENQTKPNDMVTPKPNLHAFIKEKIPVQVTVDTAYVHNSYVGVEQQSPEAAVPGILTVNDIDGVVYNFTNDSDDIARNPVILMKADGRLMNLSHVNAKIKYVMDSPTDEFVCNFKADTVSLPDLNPFIENAIFAKINDGVLEGAQVNFKSDNKESRGESHFIYHDLKLQVNKKDSVQQRRRGLLSLLANTVVRTKNTRKIGYIYAKCDPARSFAGYWVQSILSGVKATAGFTTKEQKGEKRFAKKVVDVVMRRKMRQEYIINE